MAVASSIEPNLTRSFLCFPPPVCFPRRNTVLMVGEKSSFRWHESSSLAAVVSDLLGRSIRPETIMLKFRLLTARIVPIIVLTIVDLFITMFAPIPLPAGAGIIEWATEEDRDGTEV